MIFKKKEEFTEFDTQDKFNYLDNIKNNESNISSFLTIQRAVINSATFVSCLTQGVQNILGHSRKLWMKQKN